MLSKEVIEQFKTSIRFKEICVSQLSRYYDWDFGQINEFKDIINYEEMMFMKNEKVVWSLELIDSIKDKLDWGSLWKTNGLELNLAFFEQYENSIDFSFIHHHKNIDWSNQLLDTYKDKWDWKGLSHKSIVTSIRNIDKYGNLLDWDRFSANNHLTLDETIIDEYLTKWNWNKLSANKNLILDKKGIEKYKHHLCFKGLSRNESMMPFILAYPNDYEWNWHYFVQNKAIVFGDKLIEFLTKKFISDHPAFKRQSQDWQVNTAKGKLVWAVISNFYFDREIWLSKSFINNAPWQQLIQRKPELLSTQEIEDNINLEDFKTGFPYRLVQKFSKEFIKKNTETLLKFRWKVFRYGKIDEEFIKKNSISEDWFQLAFNESFDWDVDFLRLNLDKFESNYGLSQNKRLFDLIFSAATKEDIYSLLKTY